MKTPRSRRAISPPKHNRAARKNILLKPLDSRPSQEWNAIGYPSGTIAMSDSVEGRLALLTGMRDHLTAHPGKAVTIEDISFTSAERETLGKTLSDAQSALNDAGGSACAGKRCARGCGG